MRIANAFRPIRAEDELQTKRDKYETEIARAIINSKTESPRKRLAFGRHWIEDEQDGSFYRETSGDPLYAPHVQYFYVREDGVPIMLEPADPPSRTELEARQARKEQRRADKEAAAKALNKERRKAAGR